MSNAKEKDIISIIRNEINDFDRKAAEKEIGTVVQVGDGIATVYGMDRAMYG